MRFPCKECGGVIDVGDELLEDSDDWINVKCHVCGANRSYSRIRIESVV